jgi:hypothetical protein
MPALEDCTQTMLHADHAARIEGELKPNLRDTQDH